MKSMRTAAARKKRPQPRKTTSAGEESARTIRTQHGAKSLGQESEERRSPPHRNPSDVAAAHRLAGGALANVHFAEKTRCRAATWCCRKSTFGTHRAGVSSPLAAAISLQTRRVLAAANSPRIAGGSVNSWVSRAAQLASNSRAPSHARRRGLVAMIELHRRKLHLLPAARPPIAGRERDHEPTTALIFS